MMRVQVYLHGSFLAEIAEGQDLKSPELRKEFLKQFYERLAEMDEEVFTFWIESR